MKPADAEIVENVFQKTRHRLRLRDWEHIKQADIEPDSVKLLIDTYHVRVLVREDRYEKHGVRLLFYVKSPSGKWNIEFDQTVWDDPKDFEPFVWEKIGRRKTAEEFHEQREFEKMCHRPGTKKTPLDSYQRVWKDPSTPKMEKYW